jgi:hypothetical protein
LIITGRNSPRAALKKRRNAAGSKISMAFRGKRPRGAERAFEEDQRRTKVISHLWDEGSVVKLVFAVLIRVNERWRKKQFSEFEQRQIRILRQTLALDQPLVPEEETKARRPLLRVDRVSLLVSITQPAEEGLVRTTLSPAEK